ncbi:MAG: hypothetical protein AAFX99_07825, partial [Myxococcota bacterium]
MMDPNRPTPTAALMLALLLCVTAACAGSQRPDDGLPKANADLQTLTATLSDSPIAMATSMDAIRTVEQKLTPMFASMLDLPPSVGLFEAIAASDPEARQLVELLDRLDPQRPLVLALRLPEWFTTYQEMGYGVLPDFNMSDGAATRVTLMLPCDDPNALEADLANLIGNMGGQTAPPIPEEARAILGDRKVMAGPDVALVMGKQPNYLVIDIIADPNQTPMKRLATMLKAMEAPKRPRTPAWGHFQSGESQAAIYMD